MLDRCSGRKWDEEISQELMLEGKEHMEAREAGGVRRQMIGLVDFAQEYLLGYQDIIARGGYSICICIRIARRWDWKISMDGWQASRFKFNGF